MSRCLDPVNHQTTETTKPLEVHPKKSSVIDSPSFWEKPTGRLNGRTGLNGLMSDSQLSSESEATLSASCLRLVKGRRGPVLVLLQVDCEDLPITCLFLPPFRLRLVNNAHKVHDAHSLAHTFGLAANGGAVAVQRNWRAREGMHVD